MNLQLDAGRQVALQFFLSCQLEYLVVEDQSISVAISQNDLLHVRIRYQLESGLEFAQHRLAGVAEQRVDGGESRLVLFHRRQAVLDPFDDELTLLVDLLVGSGVGQACQDVLGQVDLRELLRNVEVTGG